MEIGKGMKNEGRCYLRERETRKGMETERRCHLGWEGRRKVFRRDLNEPEKYMNFPISKKKKPKTLVL